MDRDETVIECIYTWKFAKERQHLMDNKGIVFENDDDIFENDDMEKKTKEKSDSDEGEGDEIRVN